jgi:hypothetical protein
MKRNRPVAPRHDLLRLLAPEEERTLWEVRLEAETPEQRVHTAREHLLNIRFYGYDSITGKHLQPQPQTVN